MGASHLLSPDHASNPLPPVERPSSRPLNRVRSPLVPTVPNSPVIPQPPPHIFEYLPDNNLPPGFTPIGHPSNLPQGAPSTGETIPIPIPPPSFSSAYYNTASAGPSAIPFPASSNRDHAYSPSGRPRELSSSSHSDARLQNDIPRSSSALSDSQHSRPNIYAAAPTSNIYGPPSNINNPSSNGPPRSSASVSSVAPNGMGHRRSVSLNAGQSPSPMSRPKNLPDRMMTPGPPKDALGAGNRYSHYDPAAHLDPAYFGRDHVTEANTLVNGSRAPGSPNFSYAGMPGFS